MLPSASDFGELSRVANSFFVSIICCADDSLYIGHTSNVNERVKVHNEGQGAVWTACRRRGVLRYHEVYLSEKQAVTRERQLKRWTRAEKLALINGDQATLKALAKRRIP